MKQLKSGLAARFKTKKTKETPIAELKFNQSMEEDDFGDKSAMSIFGTILRSKILTKVRE